MSGLSPVAHRDLDCVCCGLHLYAPDGSRALVDLISEHHRILGNRKDNRLSNKILLQGSGSVGCHWRWHNPERLEAERRGYIIRGGYSRPHLSLEVPIWYAQPSLGRAGWYLADDDGDLTFIDADPEAHAMYIAEERSTHDG